MSHTLAAGPNATGLRLAAPIDRWDEAIPLGNGLMGGLLYGAGRELRLALDRGDLWDLRDSPKINDPQFNMARMVALVRAGQHDEARAQFESFYKEGTPTKIPAGRLVMTLPEGAPVDQFTLDLRTATGAAALAQAGAVQVFYSAIEPVVLLRFTGAASEAELRLESPDFTRGERAPQPPRHPGPLWALDYPAARRGSADREQWVLQSAVDGFAYALVLQTQTVAGQRFAALAITTTAEDADPVALGRSRTQAALELGYDAMHAAHCDWWQRFWSRSGVRLPDADAQLQYDLVRYFYGSSSRRGAPPMPLQGVWTADENAIPPWKGDYHHDLNTQLCYWPYLAADHLDEGLCFLDFLWDLLPAAQRFAREFFQRPGATLPSVMSLTGRPMGGWIQYSYSPTNTAWLCQAFDWHWRCTMDRAFLTERAHPFCTEVARCLEAWLEADEQGRLKLPLSSSPEVHDNRPEAWLTPTSNYDLALLRWLFDAVARMADALERDDEARHWRAVLAKLEPLAVEERSGALRLSPDESLRESHRHFSHLMAVYPLGLLHVEGSDADRQTIESSLKQIDQLGPGLWCGYSYAWMSAMAARAGQPERALHMLEMFLKGFISRNGFHLNGDYKNLGLSRLKYRPFTLEGNFAAAQAVHEMLLQSWGGRLRIFPAVSERWREVAFVDLRAEGALRVSAKREHGRTTWLRIRAEVAGPVRIRNPFAGDRATWTGATVQRAGDDYVAHLQAGDVLEGRV